ncbi:MAG: DUF4954 family protein [Spirochaetales bacterium]|nr:DUF4954 family protein [Spirochaetales bacterium]
MHNVTVRVKDVIGKGFIPPEYLPPGKDEYYLRNQQNSAAPDKWRALRKEEIETLLAGGNSAENWDFLLVSKEDFSPERIRNSRFCGLVRLGRLRNAILEHHDLQVPTGIYDSLIIDCDIGDDTAIDNVRYLARYIIGDRCILKDVDEMSTTNHAKFGNGIIKDGEPEEHRVWLDVMNETGSRAILPFDGMITADAYLWAKYRDDTALQKRLKEITQKRFSSARGHYGVIGEECVIKTSRILKDVTVGSHCYIKGANKLKNLTINSSPEEPSQIGEGVELVNGILGYGCHVFYGCKAVRFVMGDNSHLKYGARLIHSVLGDNSTVSCCEVLNNLIFPAHEQHHNNSFLVASVVLGQSNLAAGATVGSNHNSRANDNEIVAGRGFWPGLCTSLKHSSVFASFVLIAKGTYPAEMNIPLPFSLVGNNEKAGALEVMPAFWWLYNMYALARNSWKFHHRDKRMRKIQHLEFDFLAPDTVEEIIRARELLEIWTGRSFGVSPGEGPKDIGRALLSGKRDYREDLVVTGEGMEKSRRSVIIQKPREAYRAYGDMLHYYAVKNLLAWLSEHPEAGFSELKKQFSCSRSASWINLGGQLLKEEDVDLLRQDIAQGTLADWEAVHQRYNALWEKYPLEKQKHAWAVFCHLQGTEEPTQSQCIQALDGCVAIQKYIRDQVYLSRKKDYENPFRLATYRNKEEMLAAIGTVDDNSFIKQVNKETDDFIAQVKAAKEKLS